MISVKNNVLDDLLLIRRDRIEDFRMKNDKTKEEKQTEKIHDEFENLIKKVVKKEENKEKLLSLLDKFYFSLVNETVFWNEQYYKLGFSDANSLKIISIEIQEKLKDFKKKRNKK